jgi:hypothetical protein
MSTNNLTAPAIRPQDDTYLEGTQQCLDILFGRRRALDSMFSAAIESRDAVLAKEIDTRITECQGLIKAIRAIQKVAR